MAFRFFRDGGRPFSGGPRVRIPVPPAGRWRNPKHGGLLDRQSGVLATACRTSEKGDLEGIADQHQPCNKWTRERSRWVFPAGPRVRIHFPPADSLSLSRSRFRRSRTRLSARVCGAGLATESAETRKAFHCAPTPWLYICRAIFRYRSVADLGGENATPARTKSGLLRLSVRGSFKFGSGSTKA